MVVRRVPLKNVNLEQEKFYLEKQASKGLILVHRSWFLYHFAKTDRFDGTIEVDLSRKELPETQQTLADWDRLTSYRITGTDYQKIYYASAVAGRRTLTEEKRRLHFYTQLRSKLELVGVLCIAPLIILWLLMISQVFLPFKMVLPILMMLLVGIYCLICSGYVGKGIENLVEDNGELPMSRAFYILSFPKNERKRSQKILRTLALFGYARKVNDDYYRLDSSVARETLHHDLANLLELKENEIILTNVADLYFFY